MMINPNIKSKIFIALDFMLITACVPISTSTPSDTLNNTSTPIMFTATQSTAVLKTELNSPILSPTLSLTSLPLANLDGYVIVFIRDGDLYFQDGKNLPVELTHIGNNWPYIMLSDDNTRVVFTRGDDTLYSINTDGTNEQTIISNIKTYLWSPLDPGPNKGILFIIPDTHQLLCEEVQCDTQIFGSPCHTNLFLVDIVTGAIKELADVGLAFQQNSWKRNIRVSPDGKMLAIGTIDGVDILNTEGKILRKNLLQYKPSTSTTLYPSLFWLNDSSALIAANPDAFYPSLAFDNYPADTLWKYIFSTDTSIRIPLESNVPDNGTGMFDVSPDGNWIAYGGIYPNNNDADFGVFLANLQTGKARVVGNATTPKYSWSPNSRYFIFTDTSSTLVSVDQPPLIMPTCYFLNWIDGNHFICEIMEEDVYKLRLAMIESGSVNIYDLGINQDIKTNIIVKTK